jgi:arginyl-tRNA synthetase
LNIKAILFDKISNAMLLVGIPSNLAPQISLSTHPKFGDYQVNGIMNAAKILNKPPKELAQLVLDNVNLDYMATKIEVAGPGFINIFLNQNWLLKAIIKALTLPNLGINTVEKKTVVVDYSSPNVAKEMHVGHLRSTIIGDAVVRSLDFLGHTVIRANHIGDWGTQFGMLIAYLAKQKNIECSRINLRDLETLYREAKRRYDTDEKFAEESRDCVVKLQRGDRLYRAIWRNLVSITMSHNQDIYNELNVTLKNKDVIGESFYSGMLPGIIEDLKRKNLIIESNGAMVFPLDGIRGKSNLNMGIIVQKKDGAYLYATTDIACVKYRCDALQADRILYYIDSRQSQHLTQVWKVARKAGYIPDSMKLEHHTFGMMLDGSGHPFKTRKGGTVRLSDLLKESYRRSLSLIRSKSPNLSSIEQENVAKIIGIGAIKYADLSKNRTTNYIFSWDRMLAFDGDTALYIQYAYTRIVSLFRRVEIDTQDIITAPLTLLENYEIQLATKLIQFEEVISQVVHSGTPHILCSYLHKLTNSFSRFYENCPVLSTGIDKKLSRLRLVMLTQKVLKQGLNLLGIDTVEQL